MIISVASGKGGTGKTTFAVNLAYTLAYWRKRVRLLDCDVEEPNDHLFVHPEFTNEDSVSVLKPVLDQSRCTGCGKCAEACKYNAIAVIKGNCLIFNELCHSCGVCSYVCPEGALTEKECEIGSVRVASEHKPFFFADGLLNIGEVLAPKVVAAVKKYIDPEAINILDVSPGTSCPVVKAVDGTDVAVLVTEPTPFGLNDLRLAVMLSLAMKVPTGIVVNRSDGKDDIIDDYARSVGVPIVGRIPFKREYAETYSSGGILVQRHEELRVNLLDIFDRICELKGTKPPLVPKLDAASVGSKAKESIRKGRAQGHKEITVISGKGGTGKTTIVGAFAMLADQMVLADNDVDAADLHLLLKPSVMEVHDFVGGLKAIINNGKCTGCGKCIDVCHYKAIYVDVAASDSGDKTYRINPLACEGCGFCQIVCPVEAITAEPNITGQWYVSETNCGPMVHARLGIAEENSGRLVTQVRSRATDLAVEYKLGQILGDGPPGTGCPVIASVSGADLVVIVTEPTVSGVHDMERVFRLTEHFAVPALVIINKADLNDEQAVIIENIAQKYQSRVIAKIPFDRKVHDSLMAGKTVVEYSESAAAKAIRHAWAELEEVQKRL